MALREPLRTFTRKILHLEFAMSDRHRKRFAEDSPLETTNEPDVRFLSSAILTNSPSRVLLSSVSFAPRMTFWAVTGYLSRDAGHLARIVFTVVSHDRVSVSGRLGKADLRQARCERT